MLFSLFRIIATLLLLVNQVMAGGFAATCSIPGSLDGSKISGSCLREDGEWETYVNFDLNNCFTNSHGTLYGQAYGDYAASCYDCSLDGTTLYCQCNDGWGGQNFSGIDMNVYLSNINGMLDCWDIGFL